MTPVAHNTIRPPVRNAWEKACEDIQDLILRMEIKPGQVVTETALSKRLGISRTPIREALKKLEQEGLIVTTQRRKHVCILTIREIEEIFDLKICIEAAVAAWAAERASDRQRDEIQAVLGRMKRIAETRPTDASKEKAWLDEWLDSDRRFHEVLFETAGNGRARQVIRTCNMQWHRLRVGMHTLEGRVERSVIEHEAVARAILDGRPAEARKAMETHLRNLKKELIKVMQLLGVPCSSAAPG
jgi:GntR family transcriptional regulator, rspAB operon transcriptional repressor